MVATGDANDEPHVAAALQLEGEVDDLLWQALQQPAGERAAFLEARCANEDVRYVLALLLRESDDGEPFLKSGGAFDGPLWEELLETPYVLNAGARLGPYEIREAIGAGGMGEIYRAHDLRLGRDVAVKVLPRGGTETATATAVARFEREARAVAALNHPNILAIHDVGAEDDIHYVVTELLEGETLRQRLAAGAPLPPNRALEFGIQIANGLAAAHARGIVHRDLKPENIFVMRDGRLKILDFGIALFEDVRLGADGVTAPLTGSGVLLGSVGYVSPEQLMGQPATPRSDLFAFGIVMHEMLTGTHPFKRATAPETHTAILRETPTSFVRAVPALAPAVARLIDRCLEKEPAERPESARDLALVLEAGGLVPDGTTDPAPLAAPGIDAGALRRLRARILAVSGGLLLLVLGATWAFVGVTANRAVDEVLDADLGRGERVVRRLHGEQIARLGLTARLVASFPELKALFATDAATIQDFLIGYRQRVPGTPALLALGPDGAVLARTDDAPAAEGGEPWIAALVAAQGEGAMVAAGDRPFAGVAMASEAGGTLFGYLVAVELVGQRFAEAVSEATQDEVVLLAPTAVLASTLRTGQTPWRSLDEWRAAGGRADQSIDVSLGTQRFAAREVTLTSDPAVSAILLRSRDDAIGPYQRIQGGLLVIGLLALAAVAAGAFWISRLST